MSGARSSRWLALLTVAAVVLLVGGVAYALVVLIQQGPAAADETSSTLAAVAGAIVAVLAWAARRRQAAWLPASAEQVDTAVATLAGIVREQWDDEARVRSLDDHEPMPVRWHLSGGALMDHPDVIIRGGSLRFAHSSVAIQQLTDAFRALPRRRLVIVGGAGTGKTTLAVQMLRELLARPQSGDPVPVLLSISGWDPTVHPRLQDWLAAELDRTYPALRAISRNVPIALAARGRVLPVLGGFDEAEPQRWAAMITALNRTWAEGLVLTSRRAEYRDAVTSARDVLTGALVILMMARCLLSPGHRACSQARASARAEHDAIGRIDEVRRHEPQACGGCGSGLVGAERVGAVRRQVFDIPPSMVRVVEHQLLERRCGCGTVTAGAAPEGVTAPVQHGRGSPRSWSTSTSGSSCPSPVPLRRWPSCSAPRSRPAPWPR